MGIVGNDKSVWAIGGQSKEKGLSVSAKPLFYLVEAAGLEPASRTPTSKALHA